MGTLDEKEVGFFIFVFLCFVLNCEGVQTWKRKQVAQRDCAVPAFGDIKNLPIHPPGQPALGNCFKHSHWTR